MTEGRVDFAVLGATPQARLVAGLLAGTHGKSVLFVGESQSGYRLPRGIDLSAFSLTRPETWSLLKVAVPEVLRLVTRIGGRRAVRRLDPIIFADGRAGKEALAHIRHMAGAFGLAAERVPGALLGEGRQGIHLRDTALLNRPVLEPALDRWLGEKGVLAGAASVTVRADGSGWAMREPGGRVEIGQVVLADDMAILTHLPQTSWPQVLLRQPATTILTEPTAPIAAPIMHQLDTGLTLTQQAERGIAAMGPGTLNPFASALAVLLGDQRQVRQAGQSSYVRVLPADGAPVAGRMRGTGPDLLAGFGPTGVFFAPAIARWLCGAASGSENAWFGGRLPDRDIAPSSVAEFGAAA